MLTRDVMGGLALAILWVNALLVAAAAAKQVGGLLARRAVLVRVSRGRVVRGAGPEGAFAVQRVEQIGRASGDKASIVFHDRSAAGEVFGGTIAVEGGADEMVPATDAAEVWLGARELEDAVACRSTEAFTQAYAAASKARGFARTVVATVNEGASVFVARAKNGDGVVVASMDPRAVLAKNAAIGVGFIAAELAAAGACTALALRPPVFGLVSTIGGALGLAFYLGVQPLGTAVRDAMLVPSRAPVRGTWSRDASSR